MLSQNTGESHPEMSTPSKTDLPVFKPPEQEWKTGFILPASSEYLSLSHCKPSTGEAGESTR